MNTVPQPGARAPLRRPVPKSLRALLENLIDYAGLFPPAALDMNTAVRDYARYLDRDYSWILSRFVVPASRLSEFEQAQAPLRSAGGSPAVARAPSPALGSGHDEGWGAAPFPEGEGAKRAGEETNRPSGEWRLSALLGSDPAADIEHMDQFNLGNTGRARVDSVEIKVTTAAEIQRIAALLPAETTAYFEFAPGHITELLPTIREVGARAKIRAGGVTPDAIPTTDAVAAFIAECARANVAFKATAGLHHPLRSVRPLTYKFDAPRATMHGFLNVFMAAAAVYHSPEFVPENRAIVDELNATAPELEFTDDFATMRIPYTAANYPSLNSELSSGEVKPAHIRIPTAFIRRVRRHFAISFGSCSFEEPIADLQELNLL